MTARRHARHPVVVVQRFDGIDRHNAAGPTVPPPAQFRCQFTGLAPATGRLLTARCTWTRISLSARRQPVGPGTIG
jgi:hypothetical protein